MLSEQQLQTLYNSLSLTEKVGQLLQVSGAEFTADGEVTGSATANILQRSYTRPAPSWVSTTGSAYGSFRRNTCATAGYRSCSWAM